jgi:hypothetical protein
MTPLEQKELGAKGWPTDVEAAVVLGSGNLVTGSLAGSPRFGMKAAMRIRFQERLVLWQSTRGWKSATQYNHLKGKRIADVNRNATNSSGAGRLIQAGPRERPR